MAFRCAFAFRPSSASRTPNMLSASRCSTIIPADIGKTGATTGSADSDVPRVEQLPDSLRNQRFRGLAITQSVPTPFDPRQRFMTKDVPRRSLPAVLATLGVVSLNRLLLPVL